MEQPQGDDWVGLADGPLPITAAMDWAVTPACGGVVVFSGVVRDSSEGREGVTALTYEAYEEAACARLAAVVAEARVRWPVIARVAALHRTGEVALGESSVVVVVSAPHRGEAFEAARFCIDTLKESVPIWKQEHWAEGVEWSAAVVPIREAGPIRPVTT